jgi:hypothetical protein
MPEQLLTLFFPSNALIQSLLFFLPDAVIHTTPDTSLSFAGDILPLQGAEGIRSLVQQLALLQNTYELGMVDETYILHFQGVGYLYVGALVPWNQDLCLPPFETFLASLSLDPFEQRNIDALCRRLRRLSNAKQSWVFQDMLLRNQPF